MNKKIMIIVSVLAITLLIGSISMAAPKDPTPGATKPIREQNLDADGNIKVHEQGVVDVNLTNITPAIQQPVTIRRQGSLTLDAGDRQQFLFEETINATTIYWTLNSKKSVAFLTPSIPTPPNYFTESPIFWAIDLTGELDQWSMSFTNPVPIVGIQLNCENETEKCLLNYTVTGFSGE